MDDDLLADDGQFKDDGLDDLDLDEEAALLGLSDEDIDNNTPLNERQDLEYVDEEGNPVEIGENNAGLYEVAHIGGKKLGTSPDDDVLELDLDTELDSFTQENPEASIREVKSPVKSYNEKQCKRNLIPLTSRSEREKPQTLKRKELLHSPVIEVAMSSVNIAYASKSVPSSSLLAAETHENDDGEFDEESEDEGMADDHRERFKSERCNNIITLTHNKKRTDIPDTLDSVISVEETAKVQAFLDNEQRRKMRFKGRPLPRMKSDAFSRSPQPFMNRQPQQHQPPQFPSPAVPQITQTPPPVSTQPRKILINPHFRGARVPPPVTSGLAHGVTETSPVSAHVPAYESTQNMLPLAYNHQETAPQINVAPPVYSAALPSVQYRPPDYHPPPQPVQQAPPTLWQSPPPEILPPVSYSNPPPPVINYGSQPPSYHNNYNNSYHQNTNYQTPPPVPIPQAVTYNQPPPPVHLQTPAYTSPPMNAAQTNVTHLHFPNSQPSMQEPYQQMKSQLPSSHMPGNAFSQNQHLNQQSQHIQQQNQRPQLQNRPQQQNLRPMQQNLRPLQKARQQSLQSPQQSRQQNRPQNQRLQNQQQNHRFLRQGEKRLSNSNIREVPIKQPRTDPPTRINMHVNNSNIREIPLVDTLPTTQKSVTVKPVPVVEEEDEKTKELRLKIEEQKLLREQILKRKEERRRQMASQRMLDLKKRQAEQNKNVIPLTKRSEPSVAVAQPAIQEDQPKLSAKERIGMSLPNVAPAGKKKIVVVRKKQIQAANNPVTAEPKKVIVLGQKAGIQGGKTLLNAPTGNDMPKDNIMPTGNRPPVATVKPNLVSKQITPAAIPSQKKTIISLKKPAQINKIQPPSPTPQNILKKKNVFNAVNVNTAQTRKGPVLSRLGNRPRFQKSDFRSPHVPFHKRPRPPPPRFPPRFQGPRGPQFQSPQFMDSRIRAPNPGPPMNDLRLPMTPPFRERPPLLPFGPPVERPPFNEFIFEPNHPQFRHQGPGDMNHHQFHGPGPGDQVHRVFRPPCARDPNHLQFHGQGPIFQNFRSRGPDMFPPERFSPPPQFHNHMNQPRPMFEHNNNQRFQGPRFFQGSNPKQRFSRPNFNQKKQQTDAMGNTNSTIPENSPKPAAKQDNTMKEAGASSITSQITNQQHTADSEIDGLKTNTVSVENLSSSTNEGQLRKLCSAVGVVENIELIKNERKAVIKFKEVNQALTFHKKYQRHMLDLAMIQVSLVTT